MTQEEWEAQERARADAHEERQQRRADRERAEADATARRNGATGIRIG